MRFVNHVSVTVDVCGTLDWGPLVATGHGYAGLTPPFVLPLCPHIEPMLPMLWPPGFALGQNAFTDTVVHQGWCIALDGHDLGALIPHVSTPPDNLELIATIPGSSREAKFSAGDVKANGKPIAACTFFDLAIVPTPMVPCSIIPLPICGSGSTAVTTNNLQVGMHWIDMLAGWVDIIVDLLTSVLTELVGGGDMPDFMPNQWSLAPGLVRLAGQEWGGYRGDAEVAIELEVGPASRTFSVGRSGEDGRWTVGTEGRLGSEELANVHDSESVAFGGTSNAPPVVQGQVGVGLLGSSADLGASSSRPGDGQAGAFASYGSDEVPVGPAFGGTPPANGPRLEEMPEL